MSVTGLRREECAGELRVCVYERERESVCVCERGRECVRERECV